jgi:hypothetical protein
MGIGASIFLIALGLILALAVDVSVAGLDLQLIGWILVLAGAVGLVTSFVVLGGRRGHVTTVVEPVAPAPRDRDRIVDERAVRERTYDDGGM